MTDLKTDFRRRATQIEAEVDRVKLRWRNFRGSGPISILTYLGHGTGNMLYLKGRVVSDFHVTGPLETDTMWKNLRNNFWRFHTHELPYIRIRARFADVEQEFSTNDDGYFEIRLEIDPPFSDKQIWHEVEIELAEDAEVKATGRVLIPPPQIQFGVISDLDDTVIKSDVVQVTKLLANTFLRNSRTRLAFGGVAEFYHALQQGTVGGFNPIYYVTSGIWNLYDVYLDFLQVQGIPIGPMFMTDLGLTEKYLLKIGRYEHKMSAIRYLLDTYPQLAFILIGDSGERDAEIYGQIAAENPGRILAIYIRDVTRQRRDTQINEIIQSIQARGTDVLLVPDTMAAAAHAIEKGYILPEAVSATQQAHRNAIPQSNSVELVQKAVSDKR